VNIRIDGLEEKFRIFNNDEIADALHCRIVELFSRSERWIPEALSLLLQLSDQPIQNSRIEDLELLKPEPLPPPPLTWADILAEDPLDYKDGLWDDIDYAAADSEHDSDKGTNTVSDTVEDGDDSDFDTSQYDLYTDINILDEPVSAPDWRQKEALQEYSAEYDVSAKTSKSIKLTEAQLMREVIFILLGLPTPIYRQKVEGSLGFQFLDIESEHMPQESLRHLLEEFANLSHSLATNRACIRRVEDVPLLQAFQAGLGSRMNIVEEALSGIQSNMIDPSRTCSISLLDLFNEVSLITRSTRQIATILTQLQSIPQAHMPFQLLEHLYDRTCLNHSVGDTEGYKDLANLFFDCFHVYLNPVRAWMELGELNKYEKIFFVKEGTHEAVPERLWQDQFQLIQSETGILSAPRFLHLAAKKVFTTGKSVNFLKRLGQYNPGRNLDLRQRQKLDFEIKCYATMDSLSPFSTLFDLSLERWIGNMHRSSSLNLREVLEKECGLMSSIVALEVIYLSSNGAISGDMMKVIFDRIDDGIEAWNDGFLLTELFQSVLGTHPAIEAHRLAVRRVGGSCHEMQNKRRSVKILDSFKVWYNLPWPVANVIKPEAIDIYQRVFVILIQTQRAKNILQRPHLMKRNPSPSTGKACESRLVYSLRQCLLWFTNSLLTYLTNSVLSVGIKEMRVAMSKAEDVDDMIAAHENFLTRVEKQCLISENLAPIHQAVISVLDLAILFSDAHASYEAQLTSSRLAKTAADAEHVSSNTQGKKENAVSESSDDDDDDDSDEDSNRVDLSYIPFEETSYAERLMNIQASFTKSLSFVIAGLYGVHRAGGEPCWEILANSLTAGLGKRNAQAV
jgi:gamma-tubulin complex component 5